MASQFGRYGAIGAAALMTASTYVAYGAGLVATMLIARHVGPVDYGHYAYLVWMAGLFILVANNGITTAAIRFVSEAIGSGERQAAADVHGWLLLRHYGCLAVTGVAFLVIALLSTNWPEHLAIFAAVVVLSGASKADYLFSISVAKGYGRFGVEAMTTVVCSLASVVLVAAVAFSGRGGVVEYAWVFAIVSVAHLVIARLLLRREAIVRATNELQASLRPRVVDHLIWTSVLAAVAILGPRSVEIYLLNAMGHTAEVGFFAIATALARGGVDLLAAGLSTVIAPAMAHAYGAGGLEPVKVLYRDSSRYYHAVGLLLAGVGCFWAGPVVTLMYGPNYTQAADALRVMVLVGGIVMSWAAASALLMTTDNQRLRVYYSVLSILCSVVFACVLVPRWGYQGALLSFALSMLCTFVAVIVLVKVVVGVMLPMREIGLLTASALVCGVGLWQVLGDDAPAWAQMAGGLAFAAAFLVSTVLVGAWHRSDYLHLAGATRAFRFLRPVTTLLQRLGGATGADGADGDHPAPKPADSAARRCLSIVHVVDSLEFGGLERFVADLAIEQARAGDQVTVFSINRTDGFRRDLEAAGVRVVQGDKRGTLDWRVLRSLRAILRERPATIAHAHSYVPSYYAWFASVLCRRRPPLLITCHDMGERLADRKLRTLFRHAVAHARGVAMVSRGVERELVGRGHVPAAKATVVMNGVPVEPFRRAQRLRKEARERFGVPPDAFVVGAVGRLVPLKNHRQLIESVPALRELVPSVHLLIAGDGPLRDELTTLAARLGVADRVTLIGECRDVPGFLAALDVFAQPSLTEGLSIALLEACASGLA
ncbi:MAG: glycosyltransferase, partial [Burkholderiaceae bacterium]